MLDTSGWPEKKLHVLKELHLDSRNVRLEIADPKIEADIREDLFSNENVLGLVKGICSVGYLTHDVPIAVKRDGRYVMVEGNRRLAALQAIQNPQLVPDYRARILALVGEIDDRKSLSIIRVMIAPSQAEADELVAAIHTSNLRRRWGPARQAAFFQAQIDSGKKLQTLLKRYPTIDVRRFVFRANMLNEFRDAKLGDPELRDFLATKEWNQGLSALARVFESKEFLDLTGFRMDKRGRISRSISKKAFNKVASTVVRGMQSGDLNTRSLNSVKSPRFVALMDELRAVSGKPPKSNGKTSDGKAGSAGAGKADAKAKKARPGRKRKFVDTGQILIPDSYPVAVHRCVGELASLEVQKYPNSTFLLMRAVLEKTIKAFAEAKGVDIRGSGNNEKGRVQLGHALKWLLEYTRNHGPKSMMQPIERVRKGKLTSHSDALNAVNHNHQFSVDPDEALATWDSIDPIMRFAIKI